MRNIIFTSLAMGLASVATAQEGPAKGCYAREYAQAHLDSHPNQVARSVYLWVRDETFQDTVDRFAYLVVDFADQGHVQRDGHGAQRLDQSLICFGMDGNVPGCAVECDGGSFQVTKQDASSMTIVTEYLMVGETEGCGGAIDLAEVPGQPVNYKLNKVDESVCLGQVRN